MEDEIVFQNTYKLNTAYYESTGEKQAFVLSHGKNLLVLKMVGYGDDVIRYYQLEDMHAHVWIGHHRYPTKGRVWHPGGAHPFIGLNEALVHNGDFANHASISEYLAQRNIYPAVPDRYRGGGAGLRPAPPDLRIPAGICDRGDGPDHRAGLHPTARQISRVYINMLQVSHMHCSPDGPWFFLIAQSDTHKDGGPTYSLTGITDTSMLRPQVFAWQENVLDNGEKVAIGLAASEKQGIDAAMLSLAETDGRFWPRADRYWNARGGSHTDGGAFIFEVRDTPEEGMPVLEMYDKFGKSVPVPVGTQPYAGHAFFPEDGFDLPDLGYDDLFAWFKDEIIGWSYGKLTTFLFALLEEKSAAGEWGALIDTLTLMMDRRYDTGSLRRSSVLSIVDETFEKVIRKLAASEAAGYVFIQAVEIYLRLTVPLMIAVIEARGYEPEGEDSVSLRDPAAVQERFPADDGGTCPRTSILRCGYRPGYQRPAHRCLWVAGRLPGLRNRWDGDPCA